MKSTMFRRSLLFTAVALFAFSATVAAACRDRWCTTNYYACLSDANADGVVTYPERQHCVDEWSDCLIANGCTPP
ncbi:hypothetical protein [Lysobacter sp. TAB13]|jgi:hypothetical protein|uniref:hypothetical protein n=1 Tax=Lysobacter sp. TAB13 TaxID=3233065 RepID=UPI003F987DBC